jgi:hypothetical protein
MAFLEHILWHGGGVGNSGSSVPKLTDELVNKPESSTAVFPTGAPAAEENKPLFISYRSLDYYQRARGPSVVRVLEFHWKSARVDHTPERL